jgi:hypothetical protein
MSDDHELDHDDPLEIREDVTLARGVKVPEAVEARLREDDERHNPWDGACSRHLAGEPTLAGARCPICRPEGE